jgi:hypothetical protein
MTLQDVARRVVWFDPPEQTLANPQLFLAHLMVYGTLEEVLAVRQQYTARDFENVLSNPPAGVFDARSWAYWNLFFGRQTPAALPEERRFPPSE